MPELVGVRIEDILKDINSVVRDYETMVNIISNLLREKKFVEAKEYSLYLDRVHNAVKKRLRDLEEAEVVAVVGEPEYWRV